MLDEEGRSLPNESRLLLNVRDEPPALGDEGKPNVGSARVEKKTPQSRDVSSRQIIRLPLPKGRSKEEGRTLTLIPLILTQQFQIRQNDPPSTDIPRPRCRPAFFKRTGVPSTHS